MLDLGLRVGAPPGGDATFRMPEEALLRHAVLLGASGSGKTVASKVLIEEMLRSGIPSIVVDPQGDLASLALPGDPTETRQRGLGDDVAREVLARSEVVIWTPGSDAGVPLGLAPLSLQGLPQDADGRAEALALAARAVCDLLGFDMEKDAGKSAEAAIVLCLEDALARGADPGGFEGIASLLAAPPVQLATRLSGVATNKALEDLAKKIRRAMVGSTGKLFDRGVPLDIDTLLGRDARLVGGNKEGFARTRCSVIYLNSLSSSEEKEYFLAELVRALIRWMLQHPSDKPQALFFVDEIAPFLPPVRKPACRDALRILVKQARKYGIACVFATQNPGDVDYKSLAQCSTWALGRITLKQDLKKLSSFLKGVVPEHADAVEQALPGRPAGELLWLAPDVEKGVVPVKTRWLATAHKTLDLEDVKAATPPDLRARFQSVARRLRGAGSTPPPSPRPQQLPEAARAATSEPARARASSESVEPARARSSESSQERRRSAPARAQVAEPPARGAPAPPEIEGPEDVDAAPSDLEMLRPRLVELLLREVAALTADEVAGLAPDVPAGRVRRVLRELAESDEIRRERCGRAFVHWHKKHMFDLERRRLRPVLVADPRILEGDAMERAHAHARSKLLFFDAEQVSKVKLRWLPLHRVRVRADRMKGFFVKERVSVEATLYLHPVDMRVLALAGTNELRFVAAPREKAEDVKDLDEVVTEFTRSSPGALEVSSDLEPTAEPAEVEAAFRRKFAVDEVLGIDRVHLPYWEFELVDTKTRKTRSGAIDALLGGPFAPH